MNGKSITIALSLAYFATFFTMAAFVPKAAAQNEPQLVVDSDGVEVVGDQDFKTTGRLKPEVATAQIKFKWKVQIPLASGCITTIQLVYSAKAETPASGWPASVILDRSSESFTYSNSGAGGAPVANQGETKTGFYFIMTVTLPREAPAFIDGKYTATAQAKVGTGGTSGGCRMKDSDSTPVPYQIKNDYLARMTFEPSTYIQKTGQNKKVTFGITMTNLGNGETKIDTTVDQVSKSRLDAVLAPGQQLVQSKAGNPSVANKLDTVITVQTPHSNGYTNTFYSLKAHFKASSSNSILTGLATDEKALDLSVQVQGVYVPGFDPAMAIAALGLALLAFGGVRRQ